MAKVENKSDWFDRVAWGIVLSVFTLALISLYAIVLQEKVIGAIKHVENGADGYKRFMLERLANGSEKRFVLQALQEDMAFVLPGKENTPENQLKGEVISMLFYLATLFSRNRFNMFHHLIE